MDRTTNDDRRRLLRDYFAAEHCASHDDAESRREAALKYLFREVEERMEAMKFLVEGCAAIGIDAECSSATLMKLRKRALLRMREYGAIADALSDMTERDRKLLRMRYGRGLKWAEISLRLNISIETLRRYDRELIQNICHTVAQTDAGIWEN